MIRLVALLLLCTACGSCAPQQAPNPPAPPVQLDAGATSPLDECESAQQFMVQLSCPPEEDAFGGWAAECSGWHGYSVITGCIKRQTNCIGARQCLGESP